jgi:protein-arginine kinase activator protein McsA
VIKFEEKGIPFINHNQTNITMPAVSELKQIIIRLQKALDEELIQIKEFKNKCAKDSEFEKAARVRDIEKGIIAFRESLTL